MQKVLALFLFVFFVSCASQHRDAQKKLRNYVETKQYKNALQLITKYPLYKNKKNALLKNLDKAMVLFLNQDYGKSLETFERAKEISDRLYTKSISNKILSAISNDNADIYYGEKHEASLIRYYLALNHYMLYATGELRDSKSKGSIKLSEKERRFHLSAARNVLIEWNSLLDNFKSVSGGDATYKDDLLAKIFGGFIHEQMGSRRDLSIAKKLYQQSKEVLLKNYSLFTTYNNKAEKFKGNFEKLHTLSVSKVKNEFIDKRRYYTDLLRFINSKIESLRRNETHNAFFILENNLAPLKEPKKFEFPLPIAKASISSGNTDDFKRFISVTLGFKGSATPTIYFEIPVIPNKKSQKHFEIIIKDLNNNIAFQSPLALVNPINEIAHLELERQRLANYSKIGLRVALKHLTALTSAYALYKNQGGAKNFLALSIASASYTLANKGIKESERADLRAWSTIPKDYRLASTKLERGNYKLFIKEQSNKTEKLVRVFSIKSDSAQIISIRN